MSASARERFAAIGLVEWLRSGDTASAEALLQDLDLLGVRRLRTQIAWVDWHTGEGRDWFAWLLPRLAARCEVLPCFCHTPPLPGVAQRESPPPREPTMFADFLDEAISAFGMYFEWVELWNEPDGMDDRPSGRDPEMSSSMMMQGALAARQRGKRTVLGGLRPTDPDRLRLLARRGMLRHIDAVGLREFPRTLDVDARDWTGLIADVREMLSRHDVHAEVWLTGTGYSTWRNDEIEQLRQLRAVLDAPADRIYWYSASDARNDPRHHDVEEDERHHHFGLRDDHGRSKLLHRIWAGQGYDGIDALAAVHESRGAPARAPRPQRDAWPPPATGASPDTGETPARIAPGVTSLPGAGAHAGPVLITGGAGFIGTNLAARLLADGRRVLVYDNLSRPGSEHNLRWLREHYPERLQVEIADVRNRRLLRAAVAQASQVFHLAAQVAVTSSLLDPRHDFDVNLGGTLNVLEAIRQARQPPSLVFTSTNKVYGGLDDIAIEADGGRYAPRERHVREAGISELRPLDFHSPYGCSKGGADQYVLDYARSYGIDAVVLRMSCIYGPHQFGNEDQGWVAHFLIRALQQQPITLYGDGMQVRDILFVEDLVDAFLRCQASMAELRGRAFNMGGGPGNTISLLELLDRIAVLGKYRPAVEHAGWRTGDQRYYVSDTRAFAAATGWSARVDAETGVARLYRWLQARDRTGAQPAPRTQVA